MGTEPGANPFLEGRSATRSLNRARLAALPPGVPDEGVLGLTGYELLGAATLRRRITEVAERRSIQIHAPDPIRDLHDWFAAERSRPGAEEIAGRYGRSLGVLLAGLRRADARTREARPEWADRHWAYWASVRAVRLGGGLMAGRFGEVVVDAARGALGDAGEVDLDLDLAAHPAYLPLIGLARSLPAGVRSGAVLDFGQTSVKSGVARLAAGEVRSIELRGQSAAPCQALVERDPAEADVRRRRASMAQLVLDTLAADVADRLGRAATIVMRGDGDAAGDACAGLENAVVLTLGTAIGVGFPPPAGAARRLADGFDVVDPR